VLFIPELACTRGEAELEDNCFDVLKLNHIYQLMQENPDYYFHLFSFAKIYVDQMYPAPEGSDSDDENQILIDDFDRDGTNEKRWVIYDNVKADWTYREQTPFIVSLRDPTNANAPYSYGVLMVEVYS
jgi:hypothetical protein